MKEGIQWRRILFHCPCLLILLTAKLTPQSELSNEGVMMRALYTIITNDSIPTCQ
jgi:hypothetical protein